MPELKEVKSEITTDDIKAFEEAEGVKEIPSEVKPEEVKSEVVPPVTEPEKADLGDGLKDVDGETPRERALRAELTRIRKANRSKEQSELIKPTPVEIADNTDEELKKLGYDDEQVVGLKKVIDIVASKQGYVKKSTSMKEMADETLMGFIGEHPEYSPENDKDDLYWGRFKSILSSDYNINGKSSAQLKSIFTKVDRDVKEALGEKELKKDKIEAQKRKIGDSSHGASASEKTEVIPKKAVSAGNKTFVSGSHPGLVFKGFEEDEMEEMLK